MARTGVWLVGGRGSVATTAVAGALAIRAGFAEPVGLVTEIGPLAGLGLPALDDLVFGGHDVVDTPLGKRAELLAKAGALPPHLPAALTEEFARVDSNMCDGGAVPREAQCEHIARLRADLETFRTDHALDRVVVLNVASTEPPTEADDEHRSLAALDAALGAGRTVLPPSAAYAYAAMSAGCPFIDFTPSTGARLPALDELARCVGVPYAGSDGKTGETLVKSALAPMFAMRGLRVRSWAGSNLLGGGDGANLADPAARESKTRSKARGLTAMLGYPVDAPVRIEYVADLGEWKTAWDHITFAGFLGTRMTMQFTWQGCDSTLAAPLVLDLARLTARAHAAGSVGALAALGFFFKDPIGSDEHRLDRQFDDLVSWAGGLERAP